MVGSKLEAMGIDGIGDLFVRVEAECQLVHELGGEALQLVVELIRIFRQPLILNLEIVQLKTQI